MKIYINQIGNYLFGEKHYYKIILHFGILATEKLVLFEQKMTQIPVALAQCCLKIKPMKNHEIENDITAITDAN